LAVSKSHINNRLDRLDSTNTLVADRSSNQNHRLRKNNMSNMNPARLFSVEGMVVVITGGGTGIGLLMTKAFALNGAKKVYIVGRRKEKLEEAAKLSPSNIVPLVGDVTSKESLVSIAESIKNDVGLVNLVCCNSGTMPKPVGIKPTETTLAEYAKAALNLEPSDWNNTFATNATSIAFTTFAFLELLDAGNKQTPSSAPGRSSQVLVTSSIGGYLRAPSRDSGALQHPHQRTRAGSVPDRVGGQCDCGRGRQGRSAGGGEHQCEYYSGDEGGQGGGYGWDCDVSGECGGGVFERECYCVGWWEG
jgi:NAD(P)-dependent dehydrogenase (short-subunit alcohol dehydrogenase family)